MSPVRRRAARDGGRLIVLWGFLGIVSGCGSLAPHFLSESDTAPHALQLEQHRARFLESRDAADLRWLLREGVRSGMSRSEVAQVLGEAGQPVDRDFRFKRNGGHYQERDRLWKWGPDHQGQSVLLAFREGTLVNFDPEEFAATESGSDPWSAGGAGIQEPSPGGGTID